MASVTYDFTQANGAASGWSTVGAVDLVVVSNKCSTSSNTAQYGGQRAHGLGTLTEWQIDFDVDASLTVGSGASVWILNADFSGYGCFIGNAWHIQRLAPGGTPTNLTNESRPSRTEHVTMTRTSAGLMQISSNGTPTTFDATDTTYANGGIVLVAIRDQSSPTNECTVDNLVIQNFIGSPAATYAPAARQRRIRPALMRQPRR